VIEPQRQEAIVLQPERLEVDIQQAIFVLVIVRIASVVVILDTGWIGCIEYTTLGCCGSIGTQPLDVIPF